jgi:hypothetical protein
MPLECVRLLRLPGDCRALVSAEVAALGERMGEFKRLDSPADPYRVMRYVASNSPPSHPVNLRPFYGET